MKLTYLASIILLLIAFPNCRASDIEANRHAASILARNFETVFFADSDFLAQERFHGDSAENEALLQRPFGYLSLALNALNRNVLTGVLQHSDGVLVGARNFQPPQGSAGLGAVISQKCYIVLLRADKKYDFQQYLQGAPAAIVNGVPIRKWVVHIDEFGSGNVGGMPSGRPKLSTLYAVQVDHQYIVISNNLAGIRSVTNELASHQPNKLRDEIRDWKIISQYAVWGYRRYQHRGVADKMASGMEDVTPGAESISCFLDVQKRFFTLRLSINATDGERTVERLNSHQNMAHLTRSQKDIWEATIQLSQDRRTEEQMDIAMGLFGFIIYS